MRLIPPPFIFMGWGEEQKTPLLAPYYIPSMIDASCWDFLEVLVNE